MRFHVQPRCVPPQVAARHLGLTLAQFEGSLDALRDLGFPLPDPVTGNYDLEAIDRYVEARNPRFFRTVDLNEAVTDRGTVDRRLAAMRGARG